MLNRNCLKVCKVLGEPTQISKKLDLLTKTMFGYHGNNKSSDFYKDLSESQQFYPVDEKLIHFSFVLSTYTQCVVRYHLFRKYYVSMYNENT